MTRCDVCVCSYISKMVTILGKIVARIQNLTKKNEPTIMEKREGKIERKTDENNKVDRTPNSNKFEWIRMRHRWLEWLAAHKTSMLSMVALLHYAVMYDVKFGRYY